MNRGLITPLSNGQRIITLLEDADASTFAHEMAHMFLMDLEDFARVDDVSAKGLAIVDAWAAWHEGAVADYIGTDLEGEFRARELKAERKFRQQEKDYNG